MSPDGLDVTGDRDRDPLRFCRGRRGQPLNVVIQGPAQVAAPPLATLVVRYQYTADSPDDAGNGQRRHGELTIAM